MAFAGENPPRIGVLGGVGWGLGYLSPVSTLMRWFPERKGLAAGLALTSFGLGAAVGAELFIQSREANAENILKVKKDIALATAEAEGLTLLPNFLGLMMFPHSKLFLSGFYLVSKYKSGRLNSYYVCVTCCYAKCS